MTTEAVLTGKVAFVTGGSRGIGAAIVRRLAREGATVVFTYVSSPDRAAEVETAVATAGGRAVAICADGEDAGQLETAIEVAVVRFGRLDILVNNAGIVVTGLLDEYALADFDRMVAVNLRAIFVASKAAARHMGAGGSIIVIGSVNAQRTAFAGASIY